MVHPMPTKTETKRRVKISMPEGLFSTGSVIDCNTNEVLSNVKCLTLMPITADMQFWEGIITRYVISKDGQGFYLVTEKVEVTT